MSRRELFLREMGLGPVWRLRDRVEGVSEPEPGPAPTPERPAPGLTVTARPPVAPIRTDSSDRGQLIARMDWAELESAVAACRACGLCKTRKQTVFGVGDPQADWMLVGEAPGAEEDARGEPFVGQAGRLLDSMLAAVGLTRRDGGGTRVYIANVLKCRPPGNRNPEPAEVAECTPHLVRQIQLVRPRLIVAMGRFAAQTLLASDASIANMRGKVFQYQGVPTIVTYHPAYLLRNLPDKAKAWEDLCFARRTFASTSQETR